MSCYGYGRWAAPYWFIGPEQGQAPKEKNDLKARSKAWCDLGATELCDCEEFHVAINEHSWHREGKLQRTWRPLILLLLTFLNKPADKDNLRRYQRHEWGRIDGETCVIELSGLAANNITIPRDRETFRKQRIEAIRMRMLENRPRLVVMYGATQKPNWDEIANNTFPPDNILISNETVMTVTPHPVAHGLKNSYWEKLGRDLRSLRFNQG